MSAAPLASRRALFENSGVAVAGGAAVVLAACGRSSNGPKVHKIPAQARNADVTVLNQALEREHRAIAAYTAGIPLLGPGHVQAAAKVFLDQELSHAGELAGLIKQAGGKPAKPRPSYDLGRPATRHDVLRLLHALERDEIAGYLQLIPSVSPGSVRAAVAAILGNDAQHISVLRAALGMPPIPSALVTGLE